jgi:protein-L-isoaspartate(D-aspartate) O-methyltransferase
MNFEQARFNMVEQQIRPWEVLDQDILDLLFVLRREDFVPNGFANLAFSDTEIPLNLAGVNTGETMMSPKFEARILQELKIRKHESVLEIGTGSGYMAALMAHRAQQVRTIEINPALAEFAAQNLTQSGARNVTVVNSDGSNLAEIEGQFDVIVLSGSVASVQSMLSKLKVGGRLTAVVGTAPAMQAQLVTHAAHGSFTTQVLFETSAKRLRGFPEHASFVF